MHIHFSFICNIFSLTNSNILCQNAVYGMRPYSMKNKRKNVKPIYIYSFSISSNFPVGFWKKLPGNNNYWLKK